MNCQLRRYIIHTKIYTLHKNGNFPLFNRSITGKQHFNQFIDELQNNL